MVCGVYRGCIESERRVGGYNIVEGKGWEGERVGIT